MRVAVSGVNGFVGIHLARELVTRGHEVVGIGKGPVAPTVAGQLADYHECDLTLGWPPLDGVDAIVHLAGLSAVGPSFAEPQLYLEANSAPVTHLGEALLAAGPSPRVVVVSTGAVYAPGVGVSESSPTEASSPYAISKLLVEMQCGYYRRRGLDIVVMRPFNHIGPGQQQGFLLPDLIAGVASGTLTVGDLSTRRDYTDVRDVVRAYCLAVEAESIEPPVLNICSGESVSGQAMLELVVSTLGARDATITVDPSRYRPGDPAEIRGDNSLIRATLGWAPELDLATTVRAAVGALL